MLRDTCSEPGCKEHNHWYFHVRAANGRILCHGTSYNTKRACLAACRAINPSLKVVLK